MQSSTCEPRAKLLEVVSEQPKWNRGLCIEPSIHADRTDHPCNLPWEIIVQCRWDATPDELAELWLNLGCDANIAGKALVDEFAFSAALRRHGLDRDAFNALSEEDYAALGWPEKMAQFQAEVQSSIDRLRPLIQGPDRPKG